MGAYNERMSEFAGKVVVVTGGAQGIGRCIAEQFSAAGAAVCVFDLQENLGSFNVSSGCAPAPRTQLLELVPQGLRATVSQKVGYRREEICEIGFIITLCLSTLKAWGSYFYL